MKLIRYLVIVIFTGIWSNSIAQEAYVKLFSDQKNKRAILIDSLIKNFETAKEQELKISIALQLYDEFHFSEKRLLNLSEKMELDTTEINEWKLPYRNYLFQTHNILKDPITRIEFQLLSAQTDEQFSSILTELEEAELAPHLDSLFKAIIILRRSHIALTNKIISHKRKGLKAAFKLIPKKPAHQYIISSICSQMGYYHYQRQELDSAEYYYSIAINLFEKDKSIKFSYIPGYGTKRRVEFIGATYMNLGLVNERKGNLVGATDYFAQANEIYGLSIGFSKQWSEMRLMNAFLDLGDEQSAKELLRNMSSNNFTHLRKLKRYGPHILISLLGEFDLEQLKANAVLIDSIMQVEMNYFYKELNLDTKRVKSSYYYSAKADFALFDLIFQAIIPNRKKYFDKNDLQIYKNEFPADENKSGKQVQQKNQVEIYALANAIINSPNKTILIPQLVEQFGGKDYIATNLHPLRQISHLFSVYGKYKAELEVLKVVIPALENTQHTVELGKCYKQISKCYEQLGEFKKSIEFRNKFDFIEAEITQLNQHGNLAKLDKELQVSRALHEKELAIKENEVLTFKKNRLLLVVIFIVLIALLVLSLFYVNRKRILAEREKLAAENEALETNLGLEGEKVKRASVEIIKGNQSLSQLIEGVENLKGELSHENRKKMLGLLIEHKSKTQDDTWQQFNLQFENHYQGFYEKLLANFKLTESEKRLCAMHLSGLNNKEINAITGQKLSSIHTMKSKIRKKIGVENDEALEKTLKALL